MLRVGAMFAATKMARALAGSTWRRVTDKEPPIDPKSDETTWPEALAWAVLAGVMVSLARLAAEKGIESMSSRSS
jgi:hypothetical protein